MSEPTLAPAPGATRPLRRLVLENLGVATVIFALLECWRPLYFLTDDNLDGAFPLWSGIGRRLVRGESPFISDYLFGGHYNLLRDCSCFCWHPFYLLAALVTQTPARFFAVDLVALLFLWMAAAGFVCLANCLRGELRLPLGDGRLMLCTQSFTYSMLALCTGSSWIDFLANHSALPWLALGIVQAQWRRGLALTTLFSVHHLLGGHLGATVSNTLFLSLFALGVAICRRSAVPLLCWFGGYALAMLLLSPLFLPVIEGFASSGRSHGLSEGGMDRYAFPALLLPFSYLFGVFSMHLGIKYVFGFCAPWYSAAFASCAAAWLLGPALANRARWRGLEIVCAALVGLAVLFVVRPAWIGEIMTQVPVLRSMRWPFREILQLQFFLHLFLILRPLAGPLMLQRAAGVLGLAIFVGPLFFLDAPSFNPMEVDRHLVFSGDAARYWDKVKPLLKPGEVIVPVMNPSLTIVDLYSAPYSLIGGYDYPNLFEVVGGVGYSVTVPADQEYIKTHPMLNSGIYVPSQQADVLKERPNIRFVTLESVSPLHITLSTPGGAPVDLTPFLTEE